ncbi:hypothetical protein pb186bvf_008636 [Paramecium bursaria]
MYSNYGKVIYMNVVLAIHLSLCLSLTSLLPEIALQNGYKSLDTYILLIIYGSEIFGNFIGPLYLTKILYKYAFTLHALLVVPCFYTADMVTNNQPNADLYQIASTIIFGYGLGAYFVIQNFYISDCSTSRSQELLFGTTYVLMGVSSFMSGFFGEYMIKIFGRQNYFLTAAFLEVIISLLFIFVKAPIKRQKLRENIGINEEKLSLVQEVGTFVIEEKESVLEVSHSVLQEYKYHIKQRDVQRYMMLFFSSGIVIGFEYGLFYKEIYRSIKNETDQKTNELTARVFQFVGFAQIVSGIINAIARKFITIQENTIIYSNVVKLVLIITITNNFLTDYYINCFLGVLIGICDIASQFNAVITINENWGDKISVFGIYFFVQNSGIFILIIQGYLLNDDQIIYQYIIILVVSVSLNFISHYNLRYIQKQLQ